MAMPDMREPADPCSLREPSQGGLSLHARRRWGIWLMVVGASTLAAALISGIAALTRPMRVAATSDTELRSQEVAKAIAVAVAHAHLAIAAGVVGAGILVAGVICWFIRNR
jgi:hypothetical protein